MITALFRDPAQARQGLQALMEMGIARDRIVAVGTQDAREISAISGFRVLSARDDALEALRDLNLPDHDLRLFEQGLHQGCTLIAARVDREDVDDAAKVLEMFDPVDLDSSSREWLKAGGGTRAGADVGAPLGAGLTGGAQAGQTNTGSLPGMGLLAEGSDDLGTADLRTGEKTSNAGAGTTTGTGSRRSEERADREGVNELAVRSQPSPDQPGLMQRHMNRGGRIWAYRSFEEGTV
jgi:hypothetical protein